MPSPIIVKFLSKASIRQPDGAAWWQRQFPGCSPNWGRCHFVFDSSCSQYDWLVVYDDLPVVPPSNRHLHTEQLACPQENTLFITGEPSSIKIYGSAFLNQFGAVLTSHEPWALQHPGVIRSQPALRWHYGIDMDSPNENPLTYDAMLSTQPPSKTRLFSTVCSNKRMWMTLHARRYDFSMRIKQEIPDLELFGYGIRPISDKREALDPFRYHLAIENHICPHHWTEKLADAFLGYCLPFYCGAPNAADYFPEESFIAIDIRNPAQAIRTIRKGIANNAYKKGYEAICEARRLVLEEYNLFAVISREISRLEQSPRGNTMGGRITSRHLSRRSNPAVTAHYLGELLYSRSRHLISRLRN